MKLWIDGVVRDIDRARIAPNDRGFLLADGLFETMRAVDGQVRFMEEHCQRLRAGMRQLGLVIEWDDEVLADACQEVLSANDLVDASLRLTVTRGTGPRGLLPPENPVPTVMITAAGLPQGQKAPPAISLTVSSVRRNEGSPLSRIKALNYLDNILALKQAKEAGFDDALLTNNAGKVCCSSAANIFILQGNNLTTPPVQDGVLPGITRKRFMKAAIDQGFEVSTHSITVETVKQADGIFLTNSLIGVRPVADLDGSRLKTTECPIQLD